MNRSINFHDLWGPFDQGLIFFSGGQRAEPKPAKAGSGSNPCGVVKPSTKKHDFRSFYWVLVFFFRSQFWKLARPILKAVKLSFAYVFSKLFLIFLA